MGLRKLGTWIKKKKTCPVFLLLVVRFTKLTISHFKVYSSVAFYLQNCANTNSL